VETDGGSKGALLALGIVLLWLAGLAFYIAFEGTKLVGSGGSSQSTLGQIKAGLAQQVATQVQGSGGAGNG
jgi:hypothetical protein